jgi:hypothetical protein
VDSLGTWLVLVVVLLLPPIAVVGLVLRARGLSAAGPLPRFVALVAYAFAALATLAIASGAGSCVALETADLRGETISTSQRARLMSDAISQLMNCSALGLLIASIGGVWVFFWGLRVRRSSPGGPTSTS